MRSGPLYSTLYWYGTFSTFLPDRAWPDWAYERPYQDRTPKFTGHVLPDRTESRLIFFDILPMNNHKKGLKKRIGKKIWFFFLFSNVRRMERKVAGFQTVRILSICRTSRPDVMSGWTLLSDTLAFTERFSFFLLNIFLTTKGQIESEWIYRIMDSPK